MVIAIVFLLNSFFADSLYKTGDYFRAISEYKREIFYGRRNPEIYVRIARSYYELGEKEDALKWFGRAYFYDSTYKFEYACILAIDKKFDEVKWLHLDDSIQERKLKEIIENGKREKSYWKLSFLIPGSGQMLSGHTREGFFSLLWNFTCLYLMYDRVKKRDIIGGIFALNYFLRFYSGNILSSKHYEREKRIRKLEERLKKLYYISEE